MPRIPLVVLTTALTLAPLLAIAQVPVLKTAPTARKGIIVQNGREAIGPKQDDPLLVDCGGSNATGAQATAGIRKPGGEDDPVARRGLIVQGGREAIGPKQDDPASRGIIVQGGREAIGPKQDDPGSRGIIVQGGREAIGPKQDDPRAPTAAVQRPGDDHDPKARCAMQPASAGAR